MRQLTTPLTPLIHRFASSTLSPNASAELAYTITNGKTLTVVELQLGTDYTTAGGRVTLVHQPNGNASGEVETDVVFANGASVSRDVSFTFLGDGTAKVVLRRANNGGGNLRIAARWIGFES